MSTNTVDPPGAVISHVPASSHSYIGSPSITVLDDGEYVATHDLFGPGSTYNTTRVFRSNDRGESWENACTIDESFWGGLFTHRGLLYLMGTNGRFRSIVIRRSEDGGCSWTTPSDSASGLLRDDGMYHTAPMPVVEHNGRLWRAMEDMYPEIKWGRNFRALMLSAPVDADLLKADSWTICPPIAGDPAWLNGAFGGWLEGNALVAPDESVVDLLRVDYRAGDGEYAAMVRVSDDGREASFSLEDFVRFPGGCKKFTVRRDPSDGTYWTFSNAVAPGNEDYNVERARNLLVLMKSSDLREWSVIRRVLYHPQIDSHAFQYVDWQFEDDDLIVVSRTAHEDGLGGAHNQHDANFMTFHRLSDFRAYHA